jgi:hypothetical protein
MTVKSNQTCRIFVDDSVHDADHFVLTAALATIDDLAPDIARLLIEAGLVPRCDEFKSHSLKARDAGSRLLRSRLVDLLQRSRARIAIAVTPRDERAEAGADMLRLLAQLKCEGAFGQSAVSVCLDDGLLTRQVRNWLAANPTGLMVEPRADSKKVLELQLADLAASFAATIIRDEIGSVTKVISPGGLYHPDERFPLGFELWAALRYNLAATDLVKPFDAEDIIESATFPAFGLYLNPRCNAAVRDAAIKRLSRVYLGCIH